MSYAVMPSERGFLGLAPEDAVSYEQAKAVIIPFGLEASVSYGSGTSKGPSAMIKASHQVELFDEHYWCEPFRQIGVVTLEEVEIAKDQVSALNQLEACVESVVNDGKFPFVFGGEHAITPGAFRSLMKRHPRLIFLHFDAHADLRDGYMGEHYSHASAIRRCLDEPRLEVASFGIRNISAEEIPFLEANRHRIHMHWAKDKKRWDLNKVVELFRGRPTYITFDIDGFDASLMPATGTPEPGGLFWDDAIEIIQAVSQVANIVGADVNELAPIDHLHGCDFLAAKLAYKILSAAFCTVA